MPVEYVLPEKEKLRIQDGYHKFLIAEDILKKLAKMGRPNAEAEIKVEQLKAEAKRFAEAFDIELEEV